jgi:hypothetical protein
MDPISLALLAINGLSTILSNPALGGGSSVKLGQASELLGILGALISQGDDALDDLKDFTSLIEEMAAKGRAPSAGEWDVMRARSDDAHARLQAAKEELLGEEESEETVDDEVPTDSVDPEPASPAVETPVEEPVDPPEEEDPPVTG